MTDLSERLHDSEGDNPKKEVYFVSRETPLPGLKLDRIFTPKVNEFEVDEKAVYQILREELNKAIGRDTLIKLKKASIDFKDMAVKSPSETLEYHNMCMRGVLSSTTFDEVRSILERYSILEKLDYTKQ